MRLARPAQGAGALTACRLVHDPLGGRRAARLAQGSLFGFLRKDVGTGTLAFSRRPYGPEAWHRTPTAE
jgi:hypothetical protein